MKFGTILARLRRNRGWSQEVLAHRSGLSQRHLSFLETGRAQPGKRSIAALISALALRGWEQRAMIAALASAPATDVPPAAAFEPPDLKFIERLTERLTLWPAYAFRPDGTLLAANRAMNRLLNAAAPGEDLWVATAPAKGANIYDLVFHPKGLVRWMQNPEEVVPETLRRLRIEAAHDQGLAPVLDRVAAFPAARSWANPGTATRPLLVECYRLGEDILSVISVISHLASPGEFELDVLRIESFIPADAKSERLLADLALR